MLIESDRNEEIDSSREVQFLPLNILLLDPENPRLASLSLKAIGDKLSD